MMEASELERKHVLTGCSCWCDPELLQICPECEDEDNYADCWKCGGRGLVKRYDDAEPCVVAHRYDGN